MTSGLQWAGPRPPDVIWRFAVPWYWTDDIARALIEAGRLNVESAAALLSTPVALKRSEPDIDTAIQAMLDDDEIPIAA
ncbi:MAG TPA: hypothetical protein VFP67_06020 [Acidimicrobiia bacterium]|nr:hypothetical protein [Acidimicrobiia bacterium]